MVRRKSLQYISYLHRRAFSDKYLFVTNVTISLGLSTTGDVIEQHYELYRGEISHWDRTRTAHMSVSGAIVGVICHFWYKILDRHMPRRTFRAVVKKIILDQVICSPLYMSAFFFTMGVLEHKTLQETLTEMKVKFPKLYAAEWMIWPPAQFLSFYLLPTHYRVLYDNLFSLICDVYTSKVKHSKLD